MVRNKDRNGNNANERTPLLPSFSTENVNVEVQVQESAEDSEKKSASDKSTGFSFKLLSSEKKWTLVMMAFANFAACTCFSLLAPFFPKEAAMKGASQTVIGLIFSCFELWIFVSSPIFGRFISQIGPRFMFISGIFVCGGCAILFGSLDKCPSGTIFIVMCFLVRTVESLGASAYITSSFAIVANEFPSHVTTVFGALETFSGLGFMIGPPVGGALYEVGGFGMPFWVIGSLLIFCALITMKLLPSKCEIQRPDKESLVNLLTNPLVIVTCLTVICGSYSLGFLDPTLADHLDQFHLRTVVVGLIFLVTPALYAITAPLWGYLSDSKGFSFPLVILGNIASCLGFLLVGPSPLLPFIQHELWLAVISLALLGLSIGCALVPTIQCILIGARRIGFEDNIDTFGLVSGLFNSAFSLGTFIGPTVGSILQEHAGFDWSATLTAALFAFAGICFSVYILIEKCCMNVNQEANTCVIDISGSNVENQPVIKGTCESLSSPSHLSSDTCASNATSSHA